MVDDLIKESLVKVRQAVRDAALEDEIKAFLYAAGLDRMTWMHKTNHPATKQLSADIMPIICPGGEEYCGSDIVRRVRISKTIPDTLRERLEAAIERWCDEMDAIAEAAGGDVPLQVATLLTKEGPELVLGYAGDDANKHIPPGRAVALAARDGIPVPTLGDRHDHDHRHD